MGLVHDAARRRHWTWRGTNRYDKYAPSPPMTVEQSVTCPILVGRDGPLAAARDALGQARAGRGSVLLISGDAGIGKSRLLRAMIDESRNADFVVLRGSCFEADRTHPYAPLLDLVRVLVATNSAPLAAHYFGGAVQELVTLFPELATVFPGTVRNAELDPEQNRRRLFHALAEALHALSRVQPVLFTLEDVHWSDEASLDLMLHLARGVQSHSLAIALTFRSDEVDARLARLLADLDRARSATDIPLRRLDEPEMAAMVRAIFGPESDLDASFLSSLHALTDGNPFFVEEILKGLVVAGDVTSTATGWRIETLDRIRVPRTATEAVRRRLASLSDEARDVASIAAVAGRRFDFTLLQALAKRDERELLSRVKELVTAQLVVEESADNFAFRHALTREAIYAELLSRERAALHRAVAAALEQQHTSSLTPVIDALAYHTFEAGDWASARRYALEAAEHAFTLCAPREALQELQRAVTATERAGFTADRALLIARGRAHETLGEFSGADDDFRGSLAVARASADRAGEWEALHALGMLWAARDYEEAGRYRREALGVARAEGDRALIARSLNRVGNWCVNREDPRAGIPYHEEALAICEEAHDRRGVAETTDLIAMAHHISGAQPVAVVAYERSVRLFNEIGDRRGLANALAVLQVCGPSYHSSACAVVAVDGMDDLLASERPIQIAREIGWRAGEAFATVCLADCLLWRGRYDRAFVLVQRALSLAADIEHLEWQCAARRVLGTLALDLCAPAAAIPQLEAAHSIARRLGSDTWTRWTAAPLALAMTRAGDASAAQELLDLVDGLVPLASGLGEARTNHPPTLGTRFLSLARAEIVLELGEPAAALAILAQLADGDGAGREANGNLAVGPRSLGCPRLTLLRGRALAAMGRHGDAVDALEVARAEATSQEARPLLWRIDAALGAIRFTQRRRRDARAAFDGARGTAAELTRLVSDAELRESFERGVDELAPPAPAPSSRQAAKAARGGLTKREGEVAQLIAEGKANRAIAKALGIGERTVETFVADAMAKLNFSSRAQLAVWAVEQRIGRGSEVRNRPPS
jgi:DNA-binding CsgD family transcriptional regulator